jgi:hypothetical protein
MRSLLITRSLFVLLAASLLAGCGSTSETTGGSGPTTPGTSPSGSDQIEDEDLTAESEAFRRELEACNGAPMVCTVSVLARAVARSEELARSAGYTVTRNSPAEAARNFENLYSISCAAGRCTIQRRTP